MKKLSELKISPAPWKLCRDGEIVHGNGYSLMDGDGCFVLKSDARLIAAAPELYECLREAVEEKCRTCIVDGNGVCRVKEGHRCHIERWRQALAKAAGEEVANG